MKSIRLPVNSVLLAAKFVGNNKLYVDFFYCEGVSVIDLHMFKGQV